MPPNVVLIMTDQQRAGFTAGEGFALDTMPFLDSLASQGMRFPRAYTTAPACVPARTSMMTGRFPTATRVRQNSAANAVVRGDDLLDVLRAQDYGLHFSGKPHVYRDRDDYDSYAGPYMHTRGPQPRAFDDWLNSLNHAVALEPTPFPVEDQFPYRLVSDAIEVPVHEPFFTWLSFPEPHNPYQVPSPYFELFPDVPDRLCGPEGAKAKGGMFLWLRRLIEEKRPGYDDQWRRYRASYCGMLRLIDDQIRRYVEHLQSVGVWENTILIFVSDHGDYVGDYGLQRKGAGVPECLMRIPFVVTGPGVSAGVSDAFVSLADVLPTVCSLVGASIPFGVQGRSFASVLAGGSTEGFDSMYAERGYGGSAYGVDDRPPLHFPYDGPSFDELNSVTQSGLTTVVWRDRWKLTCDGEGIIELYDVEADPAELHDLAEDPAHASTRATLIEELLKWRVKVADDLPLANYTPKPRTHPIR